MIEGKLRAASYLIGDNAASFPPALNSRDSIAGAESSVRGILLGKHLPKSVHFSQCILYSA